LAIVSLRTNFDGLKGICDLVCAPKPAQQNTLQESPAFRRLSELIALTAEGRYHLLALLSSPIELPARRKLLDEHRPCDNIFVVVSGWVQLYRQLKNGGRQVLNFRLPGEVFGVESLLYRRSLYSCQAITNCSIAQISHGMFEVTQYEFPRLASAFLLTAVKDAAMHHEWAVNLGRRPAFQRIAHVFLELEQRARGALSSPDDEVLLPLTQQHIADCTGLTVPYVNRILQQMRTLKFIDYGPHGLTILDGKRLADAAGFEPDYLEVSYQTDWQRHLPGKSSVSGG
jgi:CRP-like cAMP-binding protein